MTPAQIEQTVADAILGRFDDQGWKHTFYPYEALPRLESWDDMHRCFAVAATRSTAIDARQPRSIGAPTMTTVGVRFFWLIREGAEHKDRRAALDAEVQLVNAVMQTRLDVRWAGTTQRVAVSEEHLLIETQFEITHIYPLG